MNKSNLSEINDFLNQFPKNDIVSILNSIDKKISSLHTISSKDFLYFNTLLKQYYSKIKEISEANNTVSLFFSKNLPEITEKIKEKNSLQKEYIDNSMDFNSKIIEFLSIAYSSFDLVVVPFNNYKQNLITLKYILANIKLHLGYVSLSNKEELKESVSKLENNIDDIYLQIDIINTNTSNLSKNIINLKEFANVAEEKNNTDIYDKLNKASNHIKKLSISDYWPSKITIDLTRRTQNCFANLGEVITNIQYHDIIRQKMEHIQSSQKNLINELNSLEKSDNLNTKFEEHLNFIVKIPEITDIQVAQLLYTNKDYQTSIEKITNKLISVGHEMKEINGNYNSIINNINKFEESFLNRITDIQETYNSFVKSTNTNGSNISSKFTGILKEYDSLKKDYNSIFSKEKQLRKEIKNFEFLIKSNGKNFGQELVKRLVQLLSDLQLNSNSLKSNLNNITQNFQSLNNLIVSFKFEDKSHYLGSGTIAKLNTESNEIKAQCKSYNSLSLGIAEEIASSIKKIEYYTYFKNTVEEIVSLLNDINNKINYDTLKSMVEGNKEILKKIEQLYTMKSERDVHKLLTESGKNINELLENDDNNDIDEHDIELF